MYTSSGRSFPLCRVCFQFLHTIPICGASFFLGVQSELFFRISNLPHHVVTVHDSDSVVITKYYWWKSRNEKFIIFYSSWMTVSQNSDFLDKIFNVWIPLFSDFCQSLTINSWEVCQIVHTLAWQFLLYLFLKHVVRQSLAGIYWFSKLPYYEFYPSLHILVSTVSFQIDLSL